MTARRGAGEGAVFLQRQAEMGVAPDKTRTVTQYLQWWLENVAP